MRLRSPDTKVVISPAKTSGVFETDRHGPLFGREQNLTRIAALFFAGARIVTLVGPIGIGKSRVALAHAGRCATVTRIACDTLRTKEDVRDAFESAFDDACEVIVIDDVDVLERDTRAELVALLAIDRRRFLMTSSAPLGMPGERALRLDGLAPTDARALLLHRIEALGGGWGPESPTLVMSPELESLLVEGNPLAIDVCARALTGKMPCVTEVQRAIDRLPMTARRLLVSLLTSRAPVALATVAEMPAVADALDDLAPALRALEEAGLVHFVDPWDSHALVHVPELVRLVATTPSGPSALVEDALAAFACAPLDRDALGSIPAGLRRAKIFAESRGDVVASVLTSAALAVEEAMRDDFVSAERHAAAATRLGGGLALRPLVDASVRTLIDTWLAHARLSRGHRAKAVESWCEAEARAAELRTLPDGGSEGARSLRSLALRAIVELDPRAAWLVGPRGSWVETPAGVRTDLMAAPNLRRIFVELQANHERAPRTHLSAQVICTMLWPDMDPESPSARNRVKVAIWRLRELGLRAVIEHAHGGYRLTPDCAWVKWKPGAEDDAHDLTR